MEYITQIVLKSKAVEIWKNNEGNLEAYRSIGKEDPDRFRERIFKDSERIVSNTNNLSEFIEKFLKTRPKIKSKAVDTQLDIFDVINKEDAGNKN